MIQPDPRRRMPSCAIAMSHRFFLPRVFGAPPVSRPVDSRTDRDARPVSSPRRMDATLILASSGYPNVSTPRRKSPKKGVASTSKFAVFEDAPKSEAPSTPTASFTPRRLALAERTNRTPQSEKCAIAPKPTSYAKIAKSPPPSRIPVRKAEISSPFHQSASRPVATHQAPSASRIASTSRVLQSAAAMPARPRIVSQPVLPNYATRDVATDALGMSRDPLYPEESKVATGSDESVSALSLAVLRSRSPLVVGDHVRTDDRAQDPSTELFPIGKATVVSTSDASVSCKFLRTSYPGEENEIS